MPSKRSKYIISLVLGIPIFLVLAWFISPGLRLTVMTYRLDNAGSAARIELVARNLLRDGSTTAMNVLANYASQHDLVAFGSKHRVFIVHDPSNGLIHVAKIDHWTSDTNENELNDAIYDFNLETESISLSTQSPETGANLTFSKIYIAEIEEDHVCFILSGATSETILNLKIEFDGLEQTTSFNTVFPEDIERWKKQADWPEEWN